MANHNTIVPTEVLGRGIFSSNTAMRSRTAIPKNVFLEWEGKTRIAVDRLSLAPENIARESLFVNKTAIFCEF